MTVQYGEFPLQMDYQDDELDVLIDKYISEKGKNDRSFTYREISTNLFRVAYSEGRLIKDADTVYNSPVMTDEDAERVSRLLWFRIWDKKLFVNFNVNKFATHYPNDVSFCIL